MKKFARGFIGGQGFKKIGQLHAGAHDGIGFFISKMFFTIETVFSVVKKVE
jgi:hypothetical protein